MANSDLTVGGTISGSHSLTVNGGYGTLTLSESDTYSGGTKINGGVLQLGNSAALGTGAVAANGGMLDLNGYSIVAPSFSGSAGAITNSASNTTATLTVSQGTAATSFGGSIADGAGQVALSLSGGTLTLSGYGAYTGGTTVDGGALIITNDEALLDGSNVTVGDAALFSPVVPLQAAPAAAIAPVPEPGTLALLAAILGGAVAYRRIRRRCA